MERAVREIGEERERDRGSERLREKENEIERKREREKERWSVGICVIQTRRSHSNGIITYVKGFMFVKVQCKDTTSHIVNTLSF